MCRERWRRFASETYIEFAWPRSLGALYERNGVAVALATVLGLVGFMALALGLGRSLVGGSDATFFSVFSHELMVAIFGAVFGFAVLALAIGVSRFWRVHAPGPAGAAPAAESVANALQPQVPRRRSRRGLQRDQTIASR